MEVTAAPVQAAVSNVESDVPKPKTAEVDPEAVTLDLLEWNRLSGQVASLAGTRHARDLLTEGLPVALSREESEVLHVEMEEAYLLEHVRAKSIELRGFVDIRPLVTHATKGGSLDGENLVGIADSLEAAAKLVRTLRDEEGDVSQDDGGADADTRPAGLNSLTKLPSYFEGVPVQAELRRELVQALDESGAVRDSADPGLSELRYARKELATAARKELGRLIQLKGDSLAARAASIRDDRYVLQVLAKQKHRVPGTVRDVSASGSTLFIEPKAIEPMNTKLQQLAKKEKAIERAVLKRLSGLVGAPKTASSLLTLQEAVTKVDLAAARARYSARLGGQPVAFRDPVEGLAEDASVGVQLPGLRHPLLVWRSTAEQVDNSQMVPMDVTVPPGVRAVVITGPNTGGKTVMLKTLGMAALMAKAGLRVLCEPSTGLDGKVTVPFFESVMADIGDDQSIVQSLSTFSAHVARMRRILAHASEAQGRALVLLDEVGSGTDPTEGSALGMAVLRQLVNNAALTLATTHHGRLKSLKYADSSGAFENACVEFDVESMAPTYRLLWGIPGKSNALAIAERLGLQGEVVSDARELLEEEGEGGAASMDEILSDLQRQRDAQRQLNEELAALKTQTLKAQMELEKKSKAFEASEASRRSTAQQELALELEEARETIKELIRRAQDGSSGGSREAEREAQAASQGLARLGEQSRGKGQGQGQGQGQATGGSAAAEAGSGAPEKLDPRSIVAGDRVLVPRLGEALVDVESVQGGQLTVKYGGLKMKVKAKEVTQRVKPAPPPPPPPKKAAAKSGGAKAGGGGGGVGVRFESNTLNLIGQRPSEIEGQIGRAVDKATKVGSLWVIHGHGTGALKKRVRELLNEEPMVKRIADAPANEGGAGCTVAYFK